MALVAILVGWIYQFAAFWVDVGAFFSQLFGA